MQEHPSSLQQHVTHSDSMFACIGDLNKRFQLLHFEAAVQQNNNIDSNFTNDSIKLAIGEVVQVIIMIYRLT